MSDLFGHVAPATEPPDAAEEGERRARDAYYTPDLLALAICRSLRQLGLNPTYLLEPGCGGGAFLRAMREVWPKAHLLGIDIAPACDGPGLVQKRDFFRPEFAAGVSDAAIGNPPFDLAEKFVRRGLEVVSKGGYVAFLLRITFLAGKGRVPLYREHPLWAFQPIAGRPSFTGGGSDPSEYGVFVWKKGHQGEGRILGPLEWRG